MARLSHHLVLATVICAVPLLAAGCSSDFSWSDTSTWRPESEHQRKMRELKQSCPQVYANGQNTRVVLVNGVDETYYHTECIPHTPTPPKYINRMEGR